MLTITTTHQPATDLGYLLHKHPEKLQTFELPFGKTHVFYTEASEERCTAALIMDIDPIRLTRKGRPRGTTPEALLQDYVNDRPYTASSHLSGAISGVYGTALSGRCTDRPELAETPIPLEARITSVHSLHGQELITRLFQPLGYEVSVETKPMDPEFPEWGESHHHDVTLSATVTLRDMLNHIHVLLPVLDNQKHYMIAKTEVENLMQKGRGWLPLHPESELISRRYLGHRRGLMDRAEAEIAAALENEPGNGEEEEKENGDEREKNAGENAGEATGESTRGNRDPEEETLERPTRLGELRIRAVIEAVRNSGAASVVDLGCGEGRLLEHLLKEPSLTNVAGIEVSQLALGKAERRLRMRNMTPEQKGRISLVHGSLTYRDQRISGFDAGVAMEVIEHIDQPKLEAFEDAVFGAARPGTVIVTTPNVEYNAVYFPDENGRLRHRDHRFEWTRQEFQQWAGAVAGRRQYSVEFQGIGETHEKHGEPTQMAVFRQEKTAAREI